MAVRALLMTAWWLLIMVVQLSGQSTFFELHGVWDDRYDQWELIAEDHDGEAVVVRIEQLWPLNNNWEEWRIDGDLLRGSIKTKWRGDLTRWEVRVNNTLVEINQKWRNDPNVWEIRQANKRLKIETDYRDDANVWVAHLEEGDFALFTEYRDDPRDWLIDDYVTVSLTDEAKLAMVFISLIQSLPKS